MGENENIKDEEFVLVSGEEASHVDWYQEAILNMEIYNGTLEERKLKSGRVSPIQSNF